MVFGCRVNTSNHMSKVKSFSVGAGDMFYINHNSDNFTTIDCCLDYDEDARAAKESILSEMQSEMSGKGVTRFISTHPDEDHISGLVDYDKICNIVNFYCVGNNASKIGDESDDFKKYKQLRDESKNKFELSKGCRRKWMNEENEERKSSGLECLWPITSNQKFQNALRNAAEGKSPNNISPVIKYSTESFTFLWMGDMDTDMQEEFDNKVDNSHVTVVFAPHHGRKSGHIPSSLMAKLSPKLVIVGEASSDDLDYYSNQNTITQNSAGDILFDVNRDYIDVFVSNEGYSKQNGLITNRSHHSFEGMKYLGSISNDD